MLDQLESKQRYNDYLREVRQVQLRQQLKANHSNLPQKVRRRLGDLFIAFGHYLKGKKYSPRGMQRI